MKTNHQRIPMFLLLSIIMMDLLTGMEFDLFVPSFPELSQQFHLSAFAVEALLSVNFVGYCISLFLVGSLSDRYGRKTFLLWGLGIFILGSIFCTWATLYFWLLVGRFLQGIGIAAPSILSFLIIADNYAIEKQKFFMTMLNGVMNIAVAIAPVCGSYISLHFAWRGNFYALLALGLLTFVMTVLFVPGTGQKQSTNSKIVTGYKRIFHSKPLCLLLLNIVLSIVPYWIFVGMSPLLYMQQFGVSLAHFGYYQGAFALLFAIGSFLFGLILKYCEERKTLMTAFAIFIVSFISVGGSTWTNSKSALAITLSFVPFIIGQIPSSILYPICLNYISDAKGKISAVLQGGRLIICALSLQVAGRYSRHLHVMP